MADPTFTQEPANEAIFQFDGADTKTGTTRFWVANTETDPEAGAVDALATALAACSDAHLSQVTIRARASRDNPPANADIPDTAYPSALDKAVFEFVASTGQTVTMEVPALLDSILQTDDNTLVDMEADDVKAFTDYVKANCATAQGVALTDALVKQAIRHRPSRRKNPLGR